MYIWYVFDVFIIYILRVKFKSILDRLWVDIVDESGLSEQELFTYHLSTVLWIGTEIIFLWEKDTSVVVDMINYEVSVSNRYGKSIVYWLWFMSTHMARRTSKLARSESRGKYDLSLKLQCSAIQLLEESVLCLSLNDSRNANRILATQECWLPRVKHWRISSDECVSVVS